MAINNGLILQFGQLYPNTFYTFPISYQHTYTVTSAYFSDSAISAKWIEISIHNKVLTGFTNGINGSVTINFITVGY